MKKTRNIITIIMIFISCNLVFGQYEMTVSDIRNAAAKVGFVGVKNMKLKSDETRIYNIIISENDVLMQLNVEGEYACKLSKNDNYLIYNQNYKPINRETYNMYCKELNALMFMDGVITQ